MKLKHAVNEALTNAKENGYSFDGWTPMEIAEDLADNDAMLEEYTPEEIVPYVIRRER